MATNSTKKTETKTTTNKTNTTTTATETKSKSKMSWSQFLNICSYIAVCIGGLALLITLIISKVFKSTPSFLPVLVTFANSVAWAIVACLSFKYISHKKKTWMWVVWAIAVVMIVVGMILV